MERNFGSLRDDLTNTLVGTDWHRGLTYDDGVLDGQVVTNRLCDRANVLEVRTAIMTLRRTDSNEYNFRLNNRGRCISREVETVLRSITLPVPRGQARKWG